jgi:PKD repeat protein
VFTTANAGASTNALTGAALTPGQIAVSPDQWDFGVVAVGANEERTFVVTNLGGAAVMDGSATVNAPFSIVSGSPFTLAGFASTQVLVRFTPASDGSISDSVRFTTANGGEATNAVTGTGALAPVAGFTGAPTCGVAPLVVAFTDTSTGTITSRAWDFGDGHTSTNEHPVNTYANAGTYTVSLTAVGPGGTNFLARADYIVVTSLPQAPRIDIALSGTNVIISGTNGIPGGTYYVLMSSSLELLLTDWTWMATNVFDGSGSFAFTNAVDPAVSRFFILRLP